MIVIEDTGAETFQVYLAGDVERLERNDVEFSAAEYWGSRLFQPCAEEINRAGAAQPRGVLH